MESICRGAVTYLFVWLVFRFLAGWHQVFDFVRDFLGRRTVASSVPQVGCADGKLRRLRCPFARTRSRL